MQLLTSHNTKTFHFTLQEAQIACKHTDLRSTKRLFRVLLKETQLKEGINFVYDVDTYYNGKNNSKKNHRTTPLLSAKGLRLMSTYTRNKEGLREQDASLEKNLIPLLQAPDTKASQIATVQKTLAEYIERTERAMTLRLNETRQEVTQLLEEQNRKYLTREQNLQDHMNQITALLENVSEDEEVKKKLMAMELGEKITLYLKAYRETHELVRLIFERAIPSARWSKANNEVNSNRFIGDGVLPKFGAIHLSYLKYRDTSPLELDKTVKDMLSYHKRLRLMRDEHAVSLLV